MRKSLSMAAAMLVFAAVPAVAQDFDPMQFADTDRDGKVTLAEFTAFQEGGWNFVTGGAAQVKPAEMDGMGAMMFKGLGDASGVLTKEAYMAGVPARFAATDTNKDGTVDAGELRASMRPPQ